MLMSIFTLVNGQELHLALGADSQDMNWEQTEHILLVAAFKHVVIHVVL